MIDIAEDGIEIRNEWVGFDMGINIDWRKEERSGVVISN